MEADCHPEILEEISESWTQLTALNLRELPRDGEERNDMKSLSVINSIILGGCIFRMCRLRLEAAPYLRPAHMRLEFSAMTEYKHFCSPFVAHSACMSLLRQLAIRNHVKSYA